MGRKTGLGEDPLSWITDTSEKAEAKTKCKKKTKKVRKSRTSEVPKFRTFEIKLSVLLRKDQLESLERLTREIMIKRSSDNKRERITKNTILRAYIDVLTGLNFDKENISNEKELLRRINERIKPKKR